MKLVLAFVWQCAVVPVVKWLRLERMVMVVVMVVRKAKTKREKRRRRRKQKIKRQEMRYISQKYIYIQVTTSTFRYHPTL